MSCGVEDLAPNRASMQVLTGAGYLETKFIYDIEGFRDRYRIYKL
jgi:hypothetical protein